EPDGNGYKGVADRSGPRRPSQPAPDAHRREPHSARRQQEAGRCRDGAGHAGGGVADGHDEERGRARGHLADGVRHDELAVGDPAPGHGVVLHLRQHGRAAAKGEEPELCEVQKKLEVNVHQSRSFRARGRFNATEMAPTPSIRTTMSTWKKPWATKAVSATTGPSRTFRV